MFRVFTYGFHGVYFTGFYFGDRDGRQIVVQGLAPGDDLCAIRTRRQELAYIPIIGLGDFEGGELWIADPDGNADWQISKRIVVLRSALPGKLHWANRCVAPQVLFAQGRYRELREVECIPTASLPA